MAHLVGNERVDDIPLLLDQMKQLKLSEVIDEHFKQHGNWQGLSVGKVVMGWLSYLLSQGDQVSILGSAAGIHLMVQLKTDITDKEIVVCAAQRGIGLTSAAPFYMENSRTDQFLLGYANLEEAEIDKGICRLAQALGLSD